MSNGKSPVWVDAVTVTVVQDDKKQPGDVTLGEKPAVVNGAVNGGPGPAAVATGHISRDKIGKPVDPTGTCVKKHLCPFSFSACFFMTDSFVSKIMHGNDFQSSDS